ncbi:hypothetical protein CAEBREN_11838 [Caenorhabditis brenneri]|uniref:RING-type domain-containing protein n=1 Tax=Caenorhabditis brenneri TaxID=135651 RepID=G0N6U2_CAEBE|nr:hypothetical protein CAEBREN_11838 [Caenorhabditis brenneri]
MDSENLLDDFNQALEDSLLDQLHNPTNPPPPPLPPPPRLLQDQSIQGQINAILLRNPRIQNKRDPVALGIHLLTAVYEVPKDQREELVRYLRKLQQGGQETKPNLFHYILKDVKSALQRLYVPGLLVLVIFGTVPTIDDFAKQNPVLVGLIREIPGPSRVAPPPVEAPTGQEELPNQNQIDDGPEQVIEEQNPEPQQNSEVEGLEQADPSSEITPRSTTEEPKPPALFMKLIEILGEYLKPVPEDPEVQRRSQVMESPAPQTSEAEKKSQGFRELCIRYEYFKRNSVQEAFGNYKDFHQKVAKKGIVDKLPELKPVLNLCLVHLHNSLNVEQPGGQPGTQSPEHRREQPAEQPPEPKAVREDGLDSDSDEHKMEDNLGGDQLPAQPSEQPPEQFPEQPSKQPREPKAAREDGLDSDSDDDEMNDNLGLNSKDAGVQMMKSWYQQMAQMEVNIMMLNDGPQVFVKPDRVYDLLSIQTITDISDLGRKSLPIQHIAVQHSHRKLAIMLGEYDTENSILEYWSTEGGCLFRCKNKFRFVKGTKYQTLAANHFVWILKNLCVRLEKLSFSARTPCIRRFDPPVWPFRSFFRKTGKQKIEICVEDLILEAPKYEGDPEEGVQIFKLILPHVNRAKSIVLSTWDDTELLQKRNIKVEDPYLVIGKHFKPDASMRGWFAAKELYLHPDRIRVTDFDCLFDPHRECIGLKMGTREHEQLLKLFNRRGHEMKVESCEIVPHKWNVQSRNKGDDMIADDTVRAGIVFNHNENHKPYIGECKHIICKQCVEKQEDKSCPFCQKEGAFVGKSPNYIGMDVLEDRRLNFWENLKEWWAGKGFDNGSCSSCDVKPPIAYHICLTCNENRLCTRTPEVRLKMKSDKDLLNLFDTVICKECALENHEQHETIMIRRIRYAERDIKLAAANIILELFRRQLKDKQKSIDCKLRHLQIKNDFGLSKLVNELDRIDEEKCGYFGEPVKIELIDRYIINVDRKMKELFSESLEENQVCECTKLYEKVKRSALDTNLDHIYEIMSWVDEEMFTPGCPLFFRTHSEKRKELYARVGEVPSEKVTSEPVDGRQCPLCVMLNHRSQTGKPEEFYVKNWIPITYEFWIEDKSRLERYCFRCLNFLKHCNVFQSCESFNLHYKKTSAQCKHDTCLMKDPNIFKYVINRVFVSDVLKIMKNGIEKTYFKCQLQKIRFQTLAQELFNAICRLSARHDTANEFTESVEKVDIILKSIKVQWERPKNNEEIQENNKEMSRQLRFVRGSVDELAEKVANLEDMVESLVNNRPPAPE